MYRIRDLGVKLVLHFGGEKQKIEGGGKVGYLEAGRSALLEIAFTADSTIWPIRVDGQKNVIRARNDSEMEGVVLCRTAINIKESQVSGVPHTQYPDNHVRLLRRTGPGTIEHWEIALISQNGVFWITAQRTYDVSIGVDEQGEFTCTMFEDRWPQMVDFLASILDIKTLPGLSYTYVEDDGDVPELPANEGIVLWWNAAQQMGAIDTAKGIARVHWSQIVAANGARRFLVPDQRVVFDHLRRPKTDPGSRPTGFKKEAVGVKPIAS